MFFIRPQSHRFPICLQLRRASIRIYVVWSKINMYHICNISKISSSHFRCTWRDIHRLKISSISSHAKYLPMTASAFGCRNLTTLFSILLLIISNIRHTYSVRCDRTPEGHGASKSPADGRFRIRISGNPERYVPGEVYTSEYPIYKYVHVVVYGIGRTKEKKGRAAME